MVDKRNHEDFVRRRRECLKCEKRFSTREKVERAELRVVKKDGRRESFDYDKMKKGVVIACEKRPVSMERIDKMLNNVEERLRRRGKEVNSSLIGNLVMKELMKIDKVSYIRFASVYKDFAEPRDFGKEIRVLANK